MGSALPTPVARLPAKKRKRSGLICRILVNRWRQYVKARSAVARNIMVLVIGVANIALFVWVKKARKGMASRIRPFASILMPNSMSGTQQRVYDRQKRYKSKADKAIV